MCYLPFDLLNKHCPFEQTQRCQLDNAPLGGSRDARIKPESQSNKKYIYIYV